MHTCIHVCTFIPCLITSKIHMSQNSLVGSTGQLYAYAQTGDIAFERLCERLATVCWAWGCYRPSTMQRGDC
jgi:hypothetical protein